MASIVVKQVGKFRYAYSASREGGHIMQRYLGRADDPNVVAKIAKNKAIRTIPDALRTLFWDTNPDKIDLGKHRRYVIARILGLGGLPAVQWLQMIYPVHIILEVNETNRELTERSKNFWRFWFECPLLN